MWKGSAAVCLNDNKEILMVVQENRNGEKRWSVPSGGKEEGESY